MDKNAKIYIAGHHGLVGSAIWNNLKARGYENLVGRSHKELDLLDPVQVKKFFDEEQPDAVVLAAAHVGGIMANLQYRADFIYKNLQIQQNVIGESWKHGVKKLLFLGSTCIYPGEAPQPMPEDCLLTSPLEYTNEPYAIAKIAGLKMCESFNIQYGTNYIAVMPTNLYGPNDNFHLENSHVLPAMIRKIYLAHLLEENDWEESTLHNYLDETKFLYVVFKRLNKSDKHYTLMGCQLWNMPYSDLHTYVFECWRKTIDVLKAGVVLTKKETARTTIVENNLPGISDNQVIHVRPHTSNRYYEFEDGSILGNGKKKTDGDELPDGRWMTHQSFFFNNSYIVSQLREDLK